MSTTGSSLSAGRISRLAIVLVLVSLLVGACGRSAAPQLSSAPSAVTPGTATEPGVSVAGASSPPTVPHGAVSTPGVPVAATSSPPRGQWERLPAMPGDLVALVVDPGDDKVLYASTTWKGADGGGLYRSKDGGLTWQWISDNQLGSPPQRIDALAMAGGTPPILYALAAGVLFASTDGAQTWSQRGDSGLGWSYGWQLWVAPSSAQVLYLRVQVDDTWVLARSVDGGAGWTRLEQGVPDAIRSLALHPTRDDVLYVGTPSGVFKSTNAGRTWEEASRGMEGDRAVKTLAIDPTHPDTLYAGGDPGLFKTTDGGRHWTSPEPGVCAGGFCCHPQAIVPDPVTAGLVYIVCSGAPGLVVSSDGGANWSVLPLEAIANPGAEAFAVSFTPDPVFVWSVYEHGGWRYGPQPLSASNASPPTSAPAIGTPYALRTTAHYKPGDLINADGLVLSVLGWSWGEGTGEPGFRTVDVDLVVYNPTIGVGEINYFGYRIGDADGQMYKYAGAGPSGHFGGRLQPGELQRGTAKFQVPETVHGLTFACRPERVFEGMIYVDLGDQPLALELPAALNVARPNRYALGQVIESGATSFAAVGWGVTDGGGEVTAAAGNKLIAVEFVMSNRGEQELTYSPYSHIQLQDSSRSAYPALSHVALGPQQERHVILQRGGVQRARLLFEVPAGSHDYTLAYTASDVAAPAYVELGAEPQMVAVPAEMTAQLEARYGLGQVAESGDLSFAVLGWALSEGNATFPAAPGQQFLLVDVVTANRGPPKELWRLGASLRDADYWQYAHNERSITRFSREWLPDPLVEGERVRGTLVFTVSAGAQGWVFWLGAGGGPGDEAYVALGSVPTMVEVPLELRGPDPNAHPVGETTGVGDADVVVLGWAVSDGGDPCRGGTTGQTGGAQYVCPGVGNQFLIVGLEVTNRGRGTIYRQDTELAPAIRDVTGYYYRTGPYVYVVGTAAGQGDFQRPLAPGDQGRVTLPYEVPLGGQYELVFDAKWLFGPGAGERVYFDLGSVPSGTVP